jgi:hypothetical protein
MATPTPGRTLGPYEIVASIGKGGIGKPNSVKQPGMTSIQRSSILR